MRNVLFLCTGNSARSIMAEVLLESLGQGRYQAFSAGSQPTGLVNPAAIRQLSDSGHDVTGLRSKSWDEFSGADAQAIDIVITVCDNAAGESCPVWHGDPIAAHWGIPDPASASGSASDIHAAFEMAYKRLQRRIEALVQLPLEQMSPSELRSALAGIGSPE